MRIEEQVSDMGNSFFIFKFTDQNDYDTFTTRIKTVIEYYGWQEPFADVLRTIKLLKERLSSDSEYEGFELVSLLYGEEMVKWTTNISYMVAALGSYLDTYGDGE